MPASAEGCFGALGVWKAAGRRSECALSIADPNWYGREPPGGTRASCELVMPTQPSGAAAEAGGSACRAVAPTPACAMAATWISVNRKWAVEASREAGAPPPLQLLPSAPVLANPAWRRAPSFAAAAALLVPAASATATASNREQYTASAADLAAAAEIAGAAGLAGRALWALGSRDAFFVYASRYAHLEGLQHRQRQLLPLTLQQVLPPPDGGATGGGGGSSSSSISVAADKAAAAAAAARQQQEQQAAALFHEIAADQQPGSLRLLGGMLSHLFR